MKNAINSSKQMTFQRFDNLYRRVLVFSSSSPTDAAPEVVPHDFAAEHDFRNDTKKGIAENSAKAPDITYGYMSLLTEDSGFSDVTVEFGRRATVLLKINALCKSTLSVNLVVLYVQTLVVNTVLFAKIKVDILVFKSGVNSLVGIKNGSIARGETTAPNENPN
jgi:hypothetical protein